MTVGGTTYRGNVLSGGASVPGGSFDTVNNVEMVRLPAGIPQGTPFSITVSAAGLNGDGILGNSDTTDQNFAARCLQLQRKCSKFFLLDFGAGRFAGRARHRSCDADLDRSGRNPAVCDHESVRLFLVPECRRAADLHDQPVVEALRFCFAATVSEREPDIANDNFSERRALSFSDRFEVDGGHPKSRRDDQKLSQSVSKRGDLAKPWDK